MVLKSDDQVVMAFMEEPATETMEGRPEEWSTPGARIVEVAGPGQQQDGGAGPAKEERPGTVNDVLAMPSLEEVDWDSKLPQQAVWKLDYRGPGEPYTLLGLNSSTVIDLTRYRDRWIGQHRIPVSLYFEAAYR